MKKITITLTCMLAVFSAATVFSQNKETAKYFQIQSGLVANVDYVSQTIIIKLKPEFREALGIGRSNSVTQLLDEFNVAEAKKKFNIKSSPAMRQAAGLPTVDLSLIYEFKISETEDIEAAINKLYATGMLEYAELNYISHIDYVPNDPYMASKQYALRKLSAYQAWDIVKSDSSVVVGIVDTGTALKHRDLKNNLKKNWADPVNSIDDDGDGYIDNFIGYDLGEDDSTAAANHFHGAHVSGCAVGITDNAKGIAAPGFGSYYFPVKVSDATVAITKGYEGIVYAVDHGAQIINTSWGQNAGYSQSQQDAVTYATSKGALIVGSGGNFGNSSLNYPSAYKYVLSIASVDSLDKKTTGSSGSNYGSTLDVSAPGYLIFSSTPPDTFMTVSGTSMAAGVATGCAALVKKRFPNYNGLQVGEQLKATTDNINSQNPAYINQLGTGRINLYRAVKETPPMISMPVISETDNNGNIFTDLDTLEISGKITNFLDTAHFLKVTLRSTSPYVTILDSTVNVGQLNTLDTTDNYTDPFTVFVKTGVPTTTVTFQLVFTDSNYVGYQTFTVAIQSSVSVLEKNAQHSMLEQNHPNPAGAFTTIDFQLATSAKVNLRVYDVTGREVETIVEATLSSGQHSYLLNTENLMNGVYYYSLRSGDSTETKKMIVMKK